MTTTDPRTIDHLPVEYLFEFRVDFDPAMLVYATPYGTRIDAIASGGTAAGPRFNGEVLAGGGDWLTLPADGIARMDVRATVRTDTGEHVHYTSAGRIALDDDALDRFLAGGTVGVDEMYGRATPLFETSAELYRWMNRVVSIARVVEVSLRHIRYQLFAVE